MLASFTLPVVLALPALWYVFRSPLPVDHVAAAVESYGFDPLKPPSRLRGPGAIYQIDGSSVRKVCEATPEMLEGAIDESITENQRHNSTDRGEFSLSGSFVNAINGKLGGARVTTIEYGMKDVVIREIAEATLGKIERRLMSEKDCERRVTALLNANKKVCSGYSSLSASLFYKVRFDLSTDMTAQAKSAAADVIKEAIEENSGSQISIRSSEEFSGEKLIYGILPSSQCIVRDTSPERTSLGSPPNG